MLGFKNFLLDEDGAGVVEMILIIVVLIGLVLISVYCTGSRQESDTYQYSMHEFRGCSRVSFCTVLQTIVG